MNNTTVIVVAAGKGLRMGGVLPKQFLFIDSRPILCRTIENIAQALPEASIIVAMHPDYFDFWNDMCATSKMSVAHSLVAGGDTRFQSVANCLKTVGDEVEYILIHDGVRPFVSPELISRITSALKTSSAVVPVVPVIDSLRRVNNTGGSHIVPREEYKAVQTPQGFKSDVLLKAYTQSYTDAFTDDASVVEACGVHVDLVGGEISNIKLTTEEDINRANFFLKEVCSFKK